MNRKYLAALLVTVALAGGACGGADDPPEAAVKTATADQPARDLPTPAPGYYLMVNVNLSSPEIDAISLRVFGTTEPLAGLKEGDSPPGWSRFQAELDQALYDRAATLLDEAKVAGFPGALVAADPGSPSGCGPMACITGSPAVGYVLILDGPYDGPPPADLNDPNPAQIAKTEAQATFQQAKTAQVFGPGVAARAPHLASLMPGVSWLTFPS